MRRFVLGTAGHVDHGKTRLIEALTGTNPDRLPEEQKRGISIELGFAALSLGPGITAGIVDVPGHERFVRTMIGGASGMDAVLLIVAANEGVQPQTIEHLQICRLLGVRHLVCALTKIDLATATEVSQRQEDVRSFLETMRLGDAEIVPVSAISGEGIGQLKSHLRELAAALPSTKTDGVLLLPIDRVFSLAGVGTVITGTLSGASLHKGDRLVALPEARPLTARTLQIFGQTVETADPTTRLAANLTGPTRETLRRGQSLIREGELSPTRRLHVSLEWLPEAKPKFGKPLRFLIGTQDLAGRLIAGSDDALPGHGEIRLRTKAVVRRGDRFILRTESPPQTLAGGKVLDPQPLKKPMTIPVELLTSATPEEIARHWVNESSVSLRMSHLASRLSVPGSIADELVSSLEKDAIVQRFGRDRLVTPGLIQSWGKKLEKHVDDTGELPEADLLSQSPFRRDPDLAQLVLGTQSKNGRLIRSHGRVARPGASPEMLHPAIGFIEKGNLTPPTLDEAATHSKAAIDAVRKAAARAAEDGLLVRLSNQLYCSRQAVDRLLPSLRTHFAAHPTLNIAQWKEISQVSRKFAVPLLEYFDRERVTLCRPDRTRIPGPRLGAT